MNRSEALTSALCEDIVDLGRLSDLINSSDVSRNKTLRSCCLDHLVLGLPSVITRASLSHFRLITILPSKSFNRLSRRGSRSVWDCLPFR